MLEGFRGSAPGSSSSSRAFGLHRSMSRWLKCRLSANHSSLSESERLVTYCHVSLGTRLCQKTARLLSTLDRMPSGSESGFRATYAATLRQLHVISVSWVMLHGYPLALLLARALSRVVLHPCPRSITPFPLHGQGPL